MPEQQTKPLAERFRRHLINGQHYYLASPNPDDPDRYEVLHMIDGPDAGGGLYIGEVSRRHVVRERRTPGERIVNSRWKTRTKVWGYREWNHRTNRLDQTWVECPNNSASAAVLQVVRRWGWRL